MAITRDPFHCAEASGTCGPLVAVRGRRGTNMRAWQNQCDPKSRLQTWYRREAFAQASWWWTGMASWGPTFFEQWIEYARWQNGDPGGKSLSARDWFMRYFLRRLRYGMVVYWPPPPPGGCTYTPAVDVEWTAAGAILTFAPAIPAWRRMVVRQARNERGARLRPVEGEISHILTNADASPINISGPVGGPAVPAGWSPVAGETSQHIHVWTLDNYARQSVVRFWRLYAV